MESESDSALSIISAHKFNGASRDFQFISLLLNFPQLEISLKVKMLFCTNSFLYHFMGSFGWKAFETSFISHQLLSDTLKCQKVGLQCSLPWWNSFYGFTEAFLLVLNLKMWWEDCIHMQHKQGWREVWMSSNILFHFASKFLKSKMYWKSYQSAKDSREEK